jgi:hypothetical protein
MQKFYTSMSFRNDPDETAEEAKDRNSFEKFCVRKFFEAHCDHENGEMYSFKFSKKFLNENPLFRVDVLKDLSWEVQRLYYDAVVEMRKEEAEYDRDQGCGNQLRGGEDQPQTGQAGDHPHAGNTPE